MLMSKPRVLTSMIWCDYVSKTLKLKQGKFLNGHITYQRHMSISKYKPSTNACLWPIEFCQIVVTLGRIFSCFHDRDHVHTHTLANFHTGSYAKHVIHPSKINTPKYKEISLIVILQKERGVIEKKFMLKKRKYKYNDIYILQSRSIGKRMNHEPPPK
jgi:hypothetical protein